MSVDEVTHPIARGWIQFFHWTAYFYGAVAVGLLVAAMVGTGNPTQGMVGLAGLAGAFAVGSAVTYRRVREESVTMSTTGIHSSSLTVPVPWGAVIGLRERRWVQKVELVGRNGPLDIRLRYQLEGFSNALARVLQELNVQAEAGPFGDGRLRWALGVTVFGTAAAAALAGVGEWELGVGLLGFVALFLLAERFEGPPIQVLLTDEAVIVRRWGDEARYRLSAITAVEFDHRTLDVMISLGAGVRVGIRPRRTDPFVMFVSISEAVAHATI